MGNRARNDGFQVCLKKRTAVDRDRSSDLVTARPITMAHRCWIAGFP